MSAKECSVGDCSSKAIARGWCGKHYKQWQITGAEPTQPSRICERCGEPLGHSARRDAKWCSRACSNVAWRMANPERQAAHSKAWLNRNPEARRRYRDNWKRKHPNWRDNRPIEPNRTPLLSLSQWTLVDKTQESALDAVDSAVDLMGFVKRAPVVPADFKRLLAEGSLRIVVVGDACWFVELKPHREVDRSDPGPWVPSAASGLRFSMSPRHRGRIASSGMRRKGRPSKKSKVAA